MYRSDISSPAVRRAGALLMLLACIWAGAAAQEMHMPALTDRQDQMVQRLNVMSQWDNVFEGLLYHGGLLTERGCQPVCMANAVIAAFGVTDRQEAAAIVAETAEVLVVEWMRGEGRMELSRMGTLLSAQDRMAQAEDYPQLAQTIGGCAGEIAVLDAQLNAQTVGEYFAQRQGGVLAGGMKVQPDWTALLQIAEQLHTMGLHDALLCLASVSVGRESSGLPFSSGKNGHYVTVLMHVGTFMREGRMYLLDSLPRALKGEESGYDFVLRSPYPFTLKKTGFAQQFSAGRIRDTVISLKQQDTAAWQSASVEEKVKLMRQMILYGPGALLVAVPMAE